MTGPSESETESEIDCGALFRRVGGTFVPSAYTTGPWRTDAMHGGAASALMGVVVAEASEPDETVARVNVDLERPVPLSALTPLVRRRTVSKRVAKVSVELSADDVVVARAEALLLRGTGADGEHHQVLPPQLTEEHRQQRFEDPPHGLPIIYSRESIEIRQVSGGFGDPLPTMAWMRLTRPVIAGEPNAALAELLAVADFGSPLAQTAGPRLVAAYINVDVSVSLARAPVGPWFFLTAQRRSSPSGIALASAEVADGHGAFATINQSLLAQPFR
ncbi:MAG: acyl-CoA thioesterase domain-containing protein [Acidimicrobiia bacterium]